jgi:hypothetical protein
VIAAHSLQRRGPLFHLKDEGNHVYTFSAASDAPFQGDPDAVGWKEASTFRGLCHLHDQIFSPIETEPFVASAQQVFLIGYRATYLEIHQKRAAIAACDQLGYSQMAAIHGEDVDPKFARRVSRLQQAGRRKGLAELEGVKAAYDRAWRLGDFSDISSCVVTFDGNLSVASAGVVSPDFTAAGEPLQDLHLAGMQCLAFGTVATASGGAIVFTWPCAMDKMTRFVESFVNRPQSDLPGALLLFIFSYVSNTFFKSSWWHALRSTARVRLSQAGRTPQQYYTPVNYGVGKVVDWVINSIDVRRTARAE